MHQHQQQQGAGATAEAAADDQSLHQLQLVLKKTEEERDRLRNNILTLKAKIVDTATLINLFTESKATNKRLEEEAQKLRSELESTRRTNNMVQTQLEVMVKESGPQRDLIESLRSNIEQLKQQIEKKDSQLSATKVYVEQLQHEVADSQNLKKENSKLSKEVARLRKDVTARDDQLREVRRNLDKLSSALSTPPSPSASGGNILSSSSGNIGGAAAISGSTSMLASGTDRIHDTGGDVVESAGGLDWQPGIEETRPSKPSPPPTPSPVVPPTSAIVSPPSTRRAAASFPTVSSPPAAKKSEESAPAAASTSKTASKRGVSKSTSSENVSPTIASATPTSAPASAAKLSASKRKPGAVSASEERIVTTRVIDAQSSGPPLPPGDEPQPVKRPKRTEIPATMRTSYASTLGQKREVLTLAELRRLIQSHVDDSDAISSASALATRLVPAGKDKLGSGILEHLQLLAGRTTANTLHHRQQHDRAVSSLSMLIRAIEQKRGDFEANFLDHVARALLPPATESSDSAAARIEKRLQCMLFVAICKERAIDGLSRARVLCYDILSLAEESVGACLLAVMARSWPVILACNHDIQSDDWNIIGTTIAFNMMQRFESADPQTDPATESYRTIKQHVGWQPSLLNLDVLLATLLDMFISLAASESTVKIGPAVYSTMKALELMGVFAGWEWTYEKLIRQIWTVMNRAPPPLFAAILRLMGRLAQLGLVESDSAPNDALHDLRLKFAHILDPSSGAKRFAHEVQVCAAQALLDISDGRRENVEPILAWYRASLGSQPALILPASLQHAITLMTG